MDKIKKESVVISVALKQDMVNVLDKIASKYRVTPNKLIVNFIIAGFDEIKVLERIGLLKKIWSLQGFLKQYGIDVTKDRVENVEHWRAMNISIRIDKELNEELDNWAKDYEKTKSSLLETCLWLSIDNYRDDPLNMGVSFLKLVDAIRASILDAKKLLKKWEERSKRAREISNEMFNLTIK